MVLVDDEAAWTLSELGNDVLAIWPLFARDDNGNLTSEPILVEVELTDHVDNLPDPLFSAGAVSAEWSRQRRHAGSNVVVLCLSPLRPMDDDAARDVQHTADASEELALHSHNQQLIPSRQLKLRWCTESEIEGVGDTNFAVLLSALKVRTLSSCLLLISCFAETFWWRLSR